MSGAFDPAGPEARDVARLMWAMVGIGVAVLALVGALVLRAARAHAEGADERRRSWLVIGGGVVLPVVVLVPLVIAMLVVADRRAPRLGDVGEEITVVGYRYWWAVEYPEAGVTTANEIHLPTGTRVRLTMRTADVIHSVWVPELAGKVDMIPGETTEVILEADRPGEYQGYCAEFCGLQHARMRFVVVAHEPDDYRAWLADHALPAQPPATAAAERGRDVFERYGCGACHRVAGTTFTGGRGPDLTHLARRRTLGAGTVDNNRGQLAGWVTNPHGVKPGNLMPPTPLSGPELLDLLHYLEGLE